MPIPFRRLCRLPHRRLAALEHAALVRHVVEEVAAFAPAGRRAFERAGLDPRAFAGRRDLERLPLSRAADLASAQRDPDRRLDWRITPEPEAIRRYWSRGRRLALVLGGRRAALLLRHSYAPVLEVREETGGDTVAWSWTPLDVAAAAESGARALALLDLDREGESALVVGDVPRTARVALEHGAVQCGADVAFAGADEAAAVADRRRPTALLGRAAELLAFLQGAGAGGRARRVVVVDPSPDGAFDAVLGAAPDEAGIARLFALPCARGLFVTGAPGGDAPLGYAWYPDLGSAEVVGEDGRPMPDGEPGELVWTASTGHGTVALRYATGIRASARRRPDVEGLPRLVVDSWTRAADT